MATNREEDILEAMQRLKAESQRLIKEHRELLEVFDMLREELEQIRTRRRTNGDSLPPRKRKPN
jgi:hypothetical protein